MEERWSTILPVAGQYAGQAPHHHRHVRRPRDQARSADAGQPAGPAPVLPARHVEPANGLRPRPIHPELHLRMGRRWSYLDHPARWQLHAQVRQHEGTRCAIRSHPETGWLPQVHPARRQDRLVARR